MSLSRFSRSLWYLSHRQSLIFHFSFEYQYSRDYSELSQLSFRNNVLSFVKIVLIKPRFERPVWNLQCFTSSMAPFCWNYMSSRAISSNWRHKEMSCYVTINIMLLHYFPRFQSKMVCSFFQITMYTKQCNNCDAFFYQKSFVDFLRPNTAIVVTNWDLEVVCVQKLLSQLHFVSLETQILSENTEESRYLIIQFLSRMIILGLWTHFHNFTNCRHICS